MTSPEQLFSRAVEGDYISLPEPAEFVVSPSFPGWAQQDRVVESEYVSDPTPIL